MRRKQVRDEAPVLETDHDVLRHAYSQAVADLAELRLKGEGDCAEEGAGAIAAGIPWYMDLFGRDSLIASYAAIHVQPTLAAGALQALANLFQFAPALLVPVLAARRASQAPLLVALALAGAGALAALLVAPGAPTWAARSDASAVLLVAPGAPTWA
jgi:hypothetical protein